MRFRTARLVIAGIMIMLLCGSIVALAQASQSSEAKTRAREILNQARAALGGTAAMNAVKSLSAFGDFRSGSDSKEASGEVQLDLLLPDKLMRTLKWSQIQEMKVTSVEVMNGSQAWTDSQMKDLRAMAGGGPIGGGGMGRGGSRGGGGMGRGGGRRSAGGSSGEGSTKGPLPDYVDIADNQQILSDFSCLMLALLLHFPDSSQLEISSEGDVDIDGAKADSLKITAGNRSVMSLAIDQKTHRPIMAAYNASTADQAGAEEKQTDSLKPEMTQIQIYFSDYKAIAEKGSGDIWFPHQITKTRDGLTVEDMRIKKFQLNPHINPKQFEKKK